MADEGLVLYARQSGPIPLDAAISGAAGELVTLFGPSGAGKTTLLRVIAGLYAPREARVAVGGATWTDTARGLALAPHKRRVGFVSQRPALFPHLSALDNVRLALAHPAQKQRGLALAALTRVGMERLADRRPAALSGGEQQRVALARALAREPAILLLDEPFSGVDHAARMALREAVLALKRSLTIPAVLVTHDLDEALELADQLVLVEQGATIQAGRPRNVLASPASVAAARLLGLRNIFPATVVAAQGGAITLACAGFTLAASGDFPVGATVTWCIRASRIRLAREGEAETLRGAWLSLVDLGESRLGQVAIGAIVLEIRLPPDAVVSSTARLIAPRDAIHVFSADAARPR